MIKGQENWFNVPSPGLGGWSLFNEAEQIADNETPDIENVVFDGGFVGPRPGSELFAAKPSGETGEPIQTMVANTSDGLEYLIAIYGNKFWLWHPDNEEWLRINQTYVPTETDLMYGYQVWNNGRGDDRLYFCNGVDNFGRWDIALSTAASAASSGASTITLTDATRFPSSGTVVIKGDSSTFTEAYASKSGNTLTLSGTLSEDVSAGASIAMDITEKASMEVGKILGKHGSRLFVMNYYGGETTGWYSQLNDPEDFTTGSAIGDASTFVIADGNGPITGFHDFGQVAVIEKEDSFHSFRIVVSEDLGSKLDEIKPIISGRSLGPLGMESTLKMQNRLLFPTRTEGFFGISPVSSGDSSSTGVEIISQKIQPFVTQKLDYTNCRGTVYRQMALWSVALSGSNSNTVVLLYDTLRNAWSKFSAWAVKDWAYLNANLYYMENGTGNIYRCFTKSFHDNNNPYPVSFYTKRFSFGEASVPKTEDLVYVQGYFTPASEIFVDVLFNEGGTLQIQTFKIRQGAEGVQFSEPLTNAQGQFLLGKMAMGYVSLMEIGNLSVFRTYLSISNWAGFYNLQLRFRSNKGAFWGITHVGFNPQLEPLIPNLMVMSPLVSS